MTRKQLLRASARRRAQNARASAVIPDNGSLQLGNAAINKNLATTEAGLAGQEFNVRQNYGIQDTSDPFSRAILLRQSYDRARSAASQTLSARGQTYSGAQANAADEQRQNYEQNYAGLTKEYQGQLQNIAQRRAEARSQAGLSRAELLQNTLNQTLQSPATAVSTARPINRTKLARISKRMRLR